MLLVDLIAGELMVMGAALMLISGIWTTVRVIRGTWTV